PRPFGTPQALRPHARGGGVALPVLAAGMPSGWVRAGRREPLRVGSPHGRRSGEPLFHRLPVRYGPTARYLRALTPGIAVHRRRQGPRAARRPAPTFVRSPPMSRGGRKRRPTRPRQPTLCSGSSPPSWVAVHGTAIA